MHAVNGIDLSSSELALLRQLVALGTDRERQQHADKIMQTGNRDAPFDRLAVDVLRGLAKKKLILGFQAGPTFIFLGEVTQMGFDFVHDYDESVRIAKAKDRAAIIHDWKIASFGVLGGLLSGAFGSWVFRLIVELLGI